MFDPRLTFTFVSVADTLSFTRSAEQLAVAQPWISEQIRRLEAQLGFRLLDRTSRRVEITPQGAEFLPYARALAEANEAAQRYARVQAAEQSRTLRIGAPEVVTDLPERTELVDRFVAANPAIQLQIHSGTTPELIARLKRGELDVIIAHRSPIAAIEALESTVIATRIAHLLVPAEHPLAQLKSARLSALAGQIMISSPGRSDPDALRQAFAPFVACGAVIQPAPESHRTTIEHYAQIRRLICLRWTATRLERFAIGDMVCLPIDDLDSPMLHVAITRLRGGRIRPVVERFCAMGRTLAGQLEPAIALG